MGGDSMTRRIKPGDFVVAYDGELGVVYAVGKGKLMTTTSAHAKALKDCLAQYFEHVFSKQDNMALEEYMEKHFGKWPDLQLELCPSLRERSVLERLEIIVANDCNLNCRYCYANSGTYGRNVQRMSRDAARMYLTKLLIGKYTCVETVMLFGGEPTLCPETISEICDFFQDGVEQGLFCKLPVYTMVTNGTLIDEAVADLIQRYQIRVTISLDGPALINDFLRVDREGNGTFSQVERGLYQLKSKGITPALIEATYTSKHRELGYTKGRIREYLSTTFGVDNILVADCGRCGYDNTLQFKEDDLDDNEYQNEKYINYTLSKETFSDLGCNAGFGSCVLLPDGDVYPCHYFIEHPEYRIARYLDGYFDFSEYRDVMHRLSAAHRLQNKMCMQCPARVACQACPAGLLLCELDDSYCEAERKRQERIVLNCAKKQLRNHNMECLAACAQE